MYFQTYTISEECLPRTSYQSNQYLSSDNLFHKAKSIGDNDDIIITNDFSIGDIPEGIPLDDPLYDNLEKSNNIVNLSINTTEVQRKNKDMMVKDNGLVKVAANELEISEKRPIDDKIAFNNEEQKVVNVKHDKEKTSEGGVSKINIVSENLIKKNTEKQSNNAKVHKDLDVLRPSTNLEIINNEMKSVQPSLYNKDQATGIIVEEANLEPYKERVYIEQVSEVYPKEEVNVIYASQDDQNENVDLRKSNQEYQKDEEIPSSLYFTLEKYENEVERNEETNKENSTYQANVKEVDSNGFLISDKLNFESAEMNKNSRQDKQYSPEIRQEIPNAQSNKEADNEILKIYGGPKIQIEHEKYFMPPEGELNSLTQGAQINQAILENPIISDENEQFVDVNQGAKDIENPNLSDFHIIDTEKDLEVPDGIEGPIPAVALPPSFGPRGYVAVPYNGKQI